MPRVAQAAPSTRMLRLLRLASVGCALVSLATFSAETVKVVDAHRAATDSVGLAPFPVTVELPTGQTVSTAISALTVALVEPGTPVFDTPRQFTQLHPLTATQFSSGAADSYQESSRLAGWAAAQSILGTRVPVGVMLTGPVPSPFEDGDVLISVNGEPVTEKLAVKRLRHTRGEALVLRDGNRTTVQIKRGVRVSRNVTLLHVGAESVPLQVPSLTGVTGPSSGLALALAYIDAVTPGDISGGLSVAATGAVVAPEPGTWARVTAVGGVTHKAEAARAAGVDVMLVPDANYGEARAGAGDRMWVVPVSTVEQALVWLCLHGGQSTACRRVVPQLDGPADGWQTVVVP